MSMNFGREQSLLRQRLAALGTPAGAVELQRELGAGIACLGAPPAAIASAAQDLVAAYPQMGRAQMTAFVRTLWQSKIHELRAVGVHILSARAALVEPADLPFLEQLLGDETAAPLAEPLAAGVLGALVARQKKLWKDLERLAKAGRPTLRRAAVAAALQPIAADATVFARFEKLVEPLLADADPLLQAAIDRVLEAAAASNAEAVRGFVERHGRKVRLPRQKAKAKAAAATAPAKLSAKAPAGKVTTTKAAAKTAGKPLAAAKARAGKPQKKKSAPRG